MAKARKSAYAHLIDFFHEAPHGRLYEIAFWGGLGAVALGLAWLGNARGWMSEPLAWLLGIVGACFLGFALLPHPRRQKHDHAPPLKGKRAVIAQQVAASKAEKKKKGPPPPGPPIRRG